MIVQAEQIRNLWKWILFTDETADYFILLNQ